MSIKRALVALAACTALGLTALSASPASASISQGYIFGSGTITDDWGDEGPLWAGGKYQTSNAVGLWQYVLWAEGATEKDGTAYDYSDIDCVFGANTTYATKKLQTRWGLKADGIVGSKTFSIADNHLRGSTGKVYYFGKARAVTFVRSSGGAYRFENPEAGVGSNLWETAKYDPFTTCFVPGG
ncbi:peptidoglycan-binding protein [Streptomyces sp. TRM72054]|uniref:peptidoglycan-binding domain-containing protein n=1 Tax=Streptomyces sp. TRM72054 TaxID=2870562 RepID=UPI001C8C7D75|nr:peptidoglycan-binding domain-containing protein [Streptomyces sp. TRM72054]MBX9397164.1 peptidoglycan-binding protein [Streptomyces sp. TRM72054]